MSNRLCKDWLESYLKLTEDVESPTIFHTYSGLFALSAALGRKLFINRGAYKIYPNLYIVLIAASALCRKTTAIDIATRILRLAVPDLPLVASKISVEMLLSTLSKQYKMIGRSEAIIIAEELGVFLGSDIRNIPLVELLTKLYNCGDYISQATISRGAEICLNGYGTMLGGTTPEWLHDAFPKKATEGGFTGRCLFVYAKEPRQRRAEPKLNNDLIINLAADLRNVAQIGIAATEKREFQMDQSGKDWYVNWYEHEFHPPTDDRRLDGYYARKHDTVIKLGMLLSIAKRDDLVVDSMDLSKALNYIEILEDDLVAAIKAIHTTDTGNDLEFLHRIIKVAGMYGITHSDLLRKVSYRLRACEVKEHIDMMVESGIVDRELVEHQCVNGTRRGFVYKVKHNGPDKEAAGPPDGGLSLE